MKRALLIISFIMFSTGILIFFVSRNFNDGKLHLIFCDVGQGDAIFIRTSGGSDILIDGGPDRSILSCLDDHMPFWDKTIEAVILTHPDKDHLGGVVDVIKRYRVSALFTQPNPGKTDIYKLFEKGLADKKLSAKFVEAGDILRMPDGTELDILSPESRAPDPQANKSTLNTYSVIAKLKYGKFSALFTGDAGVEVEDRIAERAGDIDVLKVPHHGSKTGMSDYFLSMVKPEIAVISVGAKNSYGHPTQFSLDLLNNHGARIIRTDLDGEVEILSDGLSWSLKKD